VSIKGYQLLGAEKVVAAELPEPKAAPGEVLIEIERVGICGSDIEYYRHYQCGVFVPKDPFVLGHEFAGRVVALGEGVTEPAIGSRVAVEPSVPCGVCEHCKEGRYNLCNHIRFFGTAASYPHVDGGFRELVPAPVSNVFVLPEGVGPAEGALLEPLAVAVHAVRRARPVDNANILINGGGTIGQLVAMVARAFGASRITVSDPVEDRRAFALEHGVDAGVDPLADSLIDIGREEPRGGWDIVFDASGQEQAIADGIGVVRKGGRFVQIGTITRPITLPANLIMVKELDFLGTFRYNNDFPAALKLLADRRIPAMEIVTSTFPFSKTPDAFAAAASGRELKVHVEMG
jgi:2-desacetyl-2-hydroxyethyl bacteriochlorophyllide A dehydrogenase